MGIRRIDRAECMNKGAMWSNRVDERIDAGVLYLFGHVERMGNNRIVKGYMGGGGGGV